VATPAADHTTGTIAEFERPCAKKPVMPKPAAKIARQHQHVRIGAHRPFGEYDEHGRCRRAQRTGRGIRAPGDQQRRGDENGKGDQREARMRARQHDQHRAEQIGAECG
jgi:hypothetical protein